MCRKLLFVLSCVLFAYSLSGQSSGTIRATIIDADTKEPVPFANVSVEQDGTTITGGTSDFDGICLIKPVPAGRFTVKATYVGYATQQINAVLVIADQIRYLDIALTPTSQSLSEIVVVDYKVPLISKDNTQSGGAVTSEDIGKMQGRSADAVAATVGGVYAEDGVVKSVRGAREEATVYYVDGVKVRGTSAVPKGSIEQIAVVTGGLQAKYGDATGGVISVVTKGPSRFFAGSVEGHTSLWDAYQDHMLAFNLSGPLVSKKTVDPNNPDKVNKTPLIGFLLSAEGTTKGNSSPSAIGQFVMKDEYLDSIKRYPFVNTSDNSTQLTANYLGDEAYENVKARRNVRNINAMVTGKIDFKPSESTQFTVGGSFDYHKNHLYSYSYSFANWDRNPLAVSSTVRGYARFNQRFRTEQNEGEDATLVNNINYSLQFDVTRYKSEQGDADYWDDLFKYGYYGKFQIRDVATYEYGYDSISNLYGYRQNAFLYTLDTIYTTDINPLIAVYNERYYQSYTGMSLFAALPTTTDLLNGGGYLNGMAIKDLSLPMFGGGTGTINMPGTVYNSYQKGEAMQYRGIGSLSLDIKGHEIQAGFEYEKRVDRSYATAPATCGIWHASSPTSISASWISTTPCRST